MKRGSTTPITLTIEGIDLTGAEWLIVSIKRSSQGTLERSSNAGNKKPSSGDATI